MWSRDIHVVFPIRGTVLCVTVPVLSDTGIFVLQVSFSQWRFNRALVKSSQQSQGKSRLANSFTKRHTFTPPDDYYRGGSTVELIKYHTCNISIFLYISISLICRTHMQMRLPTFVRGEMCYCTATVI